MLNQPHALHVGGLEVARICKNGDDTLLDRREGGGIRAVRSQALCGAMLMGMLVLMAGCGSTESATTTAAPSSPNLSGHSEARAAAAKAAAAKVRRRKRASEKAHELARERRERQHDKVVAEEKAKREAEDAPPHANQPAKC